MSEFYKSFGRCLKRLRQDAGLTQQQLADRVAMDFKYLGEIERGKVNVTLRNIERICKALNVQPYELFMFSSGIDKNKTLSSIMSKSDDETKTYIIPLLRKLNRSK